MRRHSTIGIAKVRTSNIFTTKLCETTTVVPAPLKSASNTGQARS